MRVKTVCGHCKSKDIEYIASGRCFCNVCRTERETKDIVIETPQERTRRAVYATGNKWAIENFNATH